MGQIKDGKHMYRALEVHMILHLTLYKSYVQNLVESNIVVEKNLRETITTAITNLQNDGVQEKNKLRRNNNSCIGSIEDNRFQQNTKGVR